jgi:hypothetical protein
MLEELPAVLALAAVGGLSSPEVFAWVDACVASCEAPPDWLLDASLARSPQDRLHHLRRAAPSDPGVLLALGAAVVAHLRGRLAATALAHLGLRAAWDDQQLPPEVRAAVYDLDEEACCAHEYDGVSQPQRVTTAVLGLREAIARCCEHYATLEVVVSRYPGAAAEGTRDEG